MKFARLFFIAVLALLFILTPSGVFAQTPTPPPGNTFNGDQIVIANTYRLESGDTLDGNLLVIGGTATISQGASMTGDVVLIGGTISVFGTVTGEIVATGGAVNVEDAAVINGDLVMIGANLNRSSLARINGQVTEQVPGILEFQPSSPNEASSGSFGSNTLDKLLKSTYQSLALGILAGLIGLLLPRQLKRVAETIVQEPVTSGGIGLLASILIPIVLVILSITIILIPVAVLSAVVITLAFLLGYVSVGYEVGQRVAAFFKTLWSPAIFAGIGTLLVSLVAGFLGLIPCIGWVFGFLVSVIGLGAVALTVFGTSGKPGLFNKKASINQLPEVPPVLPQNPDSENEKESK